MEVLNILDSSLIRVTILLIPGYLGYKVYQILTSLGKKQRYLKDWEKFVNILVISIISYLLIAIGNKDAVNVFLDPRLELKFSYILLAAIIAVLINLIFVGLVNRKVFFKLFNKINMTNRFGDEDVWTYLFNKKEKNLVNVRDHKQGLVYYGYIEICSDSREERELYLTDVDVYNLDGKKLYKTNNLYICRKNDDLSIEIIKTE